MNDYKPGDIYFMPNTETPIGIVTIKEETQGEFGKYIGVEFHLSSNPKRPGSNIDIYRISEGPDIWLGRVIYEHCGQPAVFTDKIRSLVELELYLSSFKIYKNAREAIFSILHESEKELEEHFNSLQFV